MFAGSHTRGHLQTSSDGRQGQFEWGFPGAVGLPETTRTTPLLQPGDAIAFGMYVVHGSRANEHPTRWRRAFINGYAWPCAVEPDRPGRRDERKLRPIPTDDDVVPRSGKAKSSSTLKPANGVGGGVGCQRGFEGS